MINLETSLAHFPLFSSLKRRDIRKLISIATVREYPRGEVVYREGDSPDSLYVVLSGKVATYTGASRQARQDVLQYLYRGTCFGIISLMTGEPHSVTTQVANDSVILSVPRDSFNEFLKKRPDLTLAFTRILSQRVVSRSGRKTIFSSINISVFSFDKGIGTSTYAGLLAYAFAREAPARKVLLLEIAEEAHIRANGVRGLSLDRVENDNYRDYVIRRHDVDYLAVTIGAEPLETAVAVLVGILDQEYHFVVIDLPAADNSAGRSCLRQSDYIHVIVDPGTKELERQLEQLRECGPHGDTIGFVVRGNTNDSRFFFTRALEQEHVRIIATLPADERPLERLIETYGNAEYSRAVRRIAREIAGVRVGLTLGCGGSYALAHIGVLKVMEEEGIDIDIVAASSMGSLVAALWCLGDSWKDIRDKLYHYRGFSFFPFHDVSFAGAALLNGRVMKRVLKQLLGEKTFQDIRRPLLITAYDFLHRESYVFRKDAQLRTAVMASSSFPGIFPPVTRERRLLFDGGILCPLPVSQLVTEDVRKIISVYVTPVRKDVIQTYADRRRLGQLNVLDYIFGSIEAMQGEFISTALLSSDVIIHPRLPNVVWTDFSRIDYCIQQGEEEARKHIDSMRKLRIE